MNKRIVIVGETRTPIGGLLGTLSSLTAIELGACSAKSSLQKSKLNLDVVDQLIMGCVLPAGLGQAPARQVALSAGFPYSVKSTTVNKMCGSGMQAVIFAYDSILAGSSSVVLAGGMESMSNAPYVLPRMRKGSKFGHGEVVDHMLRDGLEDAYNPGFLMGVFSDESSIEYEITREELDAFAIMSLERAQAATNTGLNVDEITAVNVKNRNGEVKVEKDEQPQKAKISKIPTLKSAFSDDGRTTAANASSISDGASTMLVMTEEDAVKYGQSAIAHIIGHTCFASEPAKFCSAPSFAIAKLLKQIEWSIDEVDLFEINEAFAVVPLIAAKELDIPLDKINVRGGACALGHPIGGSGARIITTLIASLKSNGGGKGIASICLAGGEALSIAIEVK